MSGDSKTCDEVELTRVLEQLPEGVLVLDHDAVIRFVNKTAARLVKLKPKKALGSVFDFPVEDGTMRDFDVELSVKDITWGGEPARLVHLKSLKSSGAFHLEWKLEAALERAREAEDALAALQNQAPASPDAPSADVSHYEDRISELESLLELAETRADELQNDIAVDDHEQSAALQDALTQARDAEDQVRQLEEELEESRDRIRVAEEQAEVAEERAYGVELELEQLAAEKDELSESQNELQSELEDLRLALSTWRNSVDQLTAEADVAEARYAELQEKHNSAEARILETEQALAASKQKLESLELEKSGLLHASVESDELQQKFLEHQSENAQLKDRVSQLEAGLSQAEQQGLEAEQRVAELVQQMADHQSATDELLEELEDLRHQKALSAEESDELAEQLRIEMEQFEERTSQLELECEEANGRLEALQAEKDALESERDALELERDALQEQVEQESVSAQAWESEKAELQAKLSELGAAAGECNSLKKDVRRLENLLQNAEELAQKGERVEKLERKLEGALRRAEEAEERLLEERRLLNEMKLRSNKAQQDSPESHQTAPEQSRTETERLAFQDVLTGLPNQNILHRYLGFMLKQSATHKKLTAMLRIDCDNFKTITDTFGQEIGDQLIRSVGERLSSVVRNVDVLGRFSEDEFIILLSELKDQDEATVMTASVIKRLYQKMRQPFLVGEQNLQIGVSIGVSIYPLDAQNGEQMFEHSAAALKRAKETGRGQSQYFTPELQTRHIARNELDLQLKYGLENEQFEVLFQPIFDLATNQVIGVESLIRWNHPEHGTLSPDNFLQVAEDSGIIVLIGNWALRKSLECAAEWQRHGLGIFVAVNLSQRQLLQADLVTTIDSLLSELGCSPDRVLFEVPEELTGKEYPKIRENLLQLSRLGVRLAVDNFGTSATSLQDLRRGPFQVLKIDRQFISGLPAQEENVGIVLSALTMGHHLGRISVAVGVETEAERQWLAQTGCRFAQGNLLAEPLVSAKLPEFTKSR